MKPILGRMEPQAYALLRIVAGALFMMHGAQKILGWPGDKPPVGDVMSQIGLAGIIELVCGALILLGLFGSIAAFIASGEMAVAFFQVHAPQGPIPLLNGGEASMIFCFIFLYIAARGSGIWSIDAAMRGGRDRIDQPAPARY